MRKQRGAVESVLLEARRGETIAVTGLDAELQEQVRRCQPLHLHTVLPVLTPAHGLVHQRLVNEVPGVCVYLVEITKAREEASALERESVVQRRGAKERLLD